MPDHENNSYCMLCRINKRCLCNYRNVRIISRVQTVKRLWRKCKDKHLVHLDYCITPLESCSLSPAQLLMSRRPRNLLPTSQELLQPTSYDLGAVRGRLTQQNWNKRNTLIKKLGKNNPSWYLETQCTWRHCQVPKTGFLRKSLSITMRLDHT